MSHKVNKLILDITGSKRNDALSLQNRMSLFANNELIPELERIFEKLIPNDRLIKVDKLEININALKLDESLEKQILEQIGQFFESTDSFELQQQIPELSQFSKLIETSNETTHFESSQLSQQESAVLSELNSHLKQTTFSLEKEKAKNAYTTLIHFLKTGSLPWNVSELNKTTLVEFIRDIVNISELKQNLIQNILPGKPEYIQRLLNYISKEQLQKLFFPASSQTLSKLTTVLLEYANILTESTQINAFSDLQELSFQLNLNLLIEKQNNVSLLEISEYFEAKLIQEKPLEIVSSEVKFHSTVLDLLQLFIPEKLDFTSTDKGTVKDTVSNESETKFKKVEELNILTTEAENKLHSKEFTDSVNPTPYTEQTDLSEKNFVPLDNSFDSFFSQIKKSQNYEHSSNLKSEEVQKEFADETKTLEQRLKEFYELQKIELQTKRIHTETTDEDIKDIYYIENGGLVLLAPYFGHLFKALNLRDEKGFLNKNAQLKALTLTNYICTGNDEVLEHQIPLNKILCGFQPNEAVILDIKLNDEEKKQADELIEAAVKHWAVLKNTGVDAFRSTFIKRKGILSSAAEGNWLLRIERTAFDVLLDTLPWPISVHRYSWMKKLLTVEW